ncbi:serine/threonine-protein kinase brsk2 [Anaeramoeba ignava]|uniref:Serine/threonine-protein kinase brsk2 n=1 Tax=Anaeramoeba ignava TaxID=1746090 RepID=A0A9Q0LK80_ANAIG|nr:serine/threonine-protein kinase brsk2 [Anaeramoeba ignava]
MIGPYKLLQTLGTGSTGKVKLAINTETEKQVAVKIMPKKLVFATEKARINAQKEIAVLKLLNHPSVLKVFDVFESDEYLFMVMEYMPGGELFDFLVNQEFISTKQSLIFFQQLIYALEYCHNHLVCHRDLKPENILLDSFGNIKIADFGMAGLINERQLLETSCDIWSCGVILYVFLVGRLPFEGESIKDVLMKVLEAKYTIPENLAPAKKELIKGILEKDVNKRFTIEQIKQNEWFRSNFPTNYNPPHAILRQRFIKPIPENKINQSIVGNLTTLVTDKEQILRSLTSDQPNLEKIMYTLYMRKVKKRYKTESRKTGLKSSSPENSDNSNESQEENHKNDNNSNNRNNSNSNSNSNNNSKKELRQKKKEEKQSKKEEQRKKKDEQKKIKENKKAQKKKVRYSKDDLGRNKTSSKVKISIKRKNKKSEQFDLSFDLEKETNKTKKSWFGKLFKRKFKKKKTKEEKKYQKLHLDNKFEQGGEIFLKDPTEKLAKNYYVSFSINQPIMEIMRNFQEGLTKLNFNWAYPNIFTIKANFNKMKTKIKLPNGPILINKEPIKIYLISKRGTAQEFIEFCNSLIKVSNF